MLELYLSFIFVWTVYMGAETYVFGNSLGRPYMMGFLITNTILAPISFVLSAIDGVLRDRIEASL